MSGVPESEEDVAGSFFRSSFCSDFVKYIFNEKTVSDSDENVEKLISWSIYIKILFCARCQNRTYYMRQLGILLQIHVCFQRSSLQSMIF